MTDWLDRLSEAERDRLEEGPQPDWTAPMLARLTDKRFSDPDWIFERKFDGERALAFRDGDRVRLMTRNRKQIGDILGEHHNLAVLTPVLLSDPESFGGTETVEAFVALTERRQTELEAEAFAAGLRLFAEKPSALRRRWNVYWQVWREEKALRKAMLGR